jgi:hypothetical protein
MSDSVLNFTFPAAARASADSKGAVVEISKSKLAPQSKLAHREDVGSLVLLIDGARTSSDGAKLGM